MDLARDADRDALREAVGRGIEEAWKYYNVIYEPFDPDDEARQKWVDCITEQVAAIVRRELEAPADRDALWREYATARTDLVNADRELRDCVARAAEYRYPPAWACQDYLRRQDEAWHRLDAAVRALAAPPAEPQPLDLMVALRDFLRRREIQERIARALVRRHGTPPENDDDTWYPGDRWLEEADDLLRLAAAPQRTEGGRAT